MFDLELKKRSAKIIEILKEKQIKIAVAESCSGGLLSALITEIAGASEVFDRGFITYSNQSKIDLLGVKKETLDSFGAVSSEVALQMAQGAINNSLAKISVSITGIAGPDGGSNEKPVGLVFIAIGSKNCACKKFQFSGNRDKIRLSSVAAALEMLQNEASLADF